MDVKIIKQIWEKANPVVGKDSKLYRKDTTGNIMYYPSYGKDSDMGWMVTKIDGRKSLDETNLHAISKQDKKVEKKKSK